MARIQGTVEAIEADGGTALAVQTDVTQIDQVDHLVHQSLNTYGQFDVLYNIAGRVVTFGAVWLVAPKQWWHDVAVNLQGSFLCCRAVLPHMLERDCVY